MPFPRIRFFPVWLGWFAILAVPCAAQWPNYAPAGTPRLADGKPNLEASAPRASDGRPDLSGWWQNEPNNLARNVAEDLRLEDIQPTAQKIYRQRLLSLGMGVPSAFCLPTSVASLDFFPFTLTRIVESPGVTAILYGGDRGLTRTVYTDGRTLPDGPEPAWLGYSVGHWEGDTLVVTTSGFNDRAWLDFNGHPQTESLKTTERFRRRDFGHLELEVTFNDPQVFVHPFSVKVVKVLQPDFAPPEAVCENNRDPAHLVGGTGFQLSSPQLAKYAGTYEFAPGRRVSLTVFDVFLTYQEQPNGLKRTLVPQSETQFVFRDNGDDIVFEKDAQGGFTQFIQHGEVDRRATRAGSSAR